MRRLLLLAPMAAALALSACGSSNSSSSSSASTPATTAGSTTTSAPPPAAAGGKKVTLSANPGGGLSFDKAKLSVKAGKVSLVMLNPSSSGLPHGIGVSGNGLDKDGQVVQPGSTSSVTVTLKPGTYEYYCPVPSHKAAGMTGTLTVT